MCRHDGDLGSQRQKLRYDDEEKDDEKYSESVVAAAKQRRENEIAEAAEAAINDLRACDRWAIYKMCGVSSVWNFPLLDFMQTALSARLKVNQKLRENIATPLVAQFRQATRTSPALRASSWRGGNRTVCRWNGHRPVCVDHDD